MFSPCLHGFPPGSLVASHLNKHGSRWKTGYNKLPLNVNEHVYGTLQQTGIPTRVFSCLFSVPVIGSRSSVTQTSITWLLKMNEWNSSEKLKPFSYSESEFNGCNTFFIIPGLLGTSRYSIFVLL